MYFDNSKLHEKLNKNTYSKAACTITDPRKLMKYVRAWVCVSSKFDCSSLLFTANIFFRKLYTRLYIIIIYGPKVSNQNILFDWNELADCVKS